MKTNGGVEEGRTPDLCIANAALCQTELLPHGEIISILSTVPGAVKREFFLLKNICPNAVVTGFGVNIGSNNPSYNVYTDLVNFNGTTYDFEPYEVASNKDQCKSGGFNSVKRNDGSSFNNQGDCIQYVNTGK